MTTPRPQRYPRGIRRCQSCGCWLIGAPLCGWCSGRYLDEQLQAELAEAEFADLQAQHAEHQSVMTAPMTDPAVGALAEAVNRYRMHDANLTAEDALDHIAAHLRDDTPEGAALRDRLCAQHAGHQS